MSFSAAKPSLTHIVSGDEAGAPLQQFLEQTLGLSDTPRLLAAEAVVVNGKPRKPRYRVRRGDEVAVCEAAAPTRSGPRPQYRFHIMYEDDEVVVVHKGPDLLSVPDRTRHPALSQQLEAFLTEREGRATRIYPLHRLDKDVTGLVLFARTAASMRQLRRQFAEGNVDRSYVACVRGLMRPPADTLRSHLDTKGARPRSVAPDRGVPAVTHYRTLGTSASLSLLDIRLETGRKNQIRVHLSEAGRPILGDRKFGGQEQHGFNRRKIALHAYRLAFEHPRTGRVMTVDDPLPTGFRRCLSECEFTRAIEELGLEHT